MGAKDPPAGNTLAGGSFCVSAGQSAFPTTTLNQLAVAHYPLAMYSQIWGGYARISEDPRDLRSGVSRQVDDITEAIVRQGGRAEDIVWFVENDTSAYKKKRVPLVDPLGNPYTGHRVIRPVWHEALHAMRTGTVTALMVWDLDRLGRDQRDLADAVEVVQHYGRTILSAGRSGVDLSTDGGIAMAQVMMAMAVKSSADTSRRVAREARAAAEQGVPRGGKRPFGYCDDKVTPHPVEAEVVRYMAQRVIEGASLRALCVELKEQGVKTPFGNDFVAQSARNLLTNARIAGWRTDAKREVVRVDGEPVRGLWEPLLDQETFDRVQAVLRDPRRVSRAERPGARKYLLSGLLRCGICNSPLYGRTDVRKDVFYYACPAERGERHGLACSGKSVDRIVSAMVGYRLSQAPATAIQQGEWTGEERLAEIAEMTKESLQRLRTSPALQQVIFDHLETLEGERHDLEMQKAQWLRETTGPSVEQLSPDEWEDMPVEQKRLHIENVLSSIVVMPPTRKGSTFDPERLVPAWR